MQAHNCLSGLIGTPKDITIAVTHHITQQLYITVYRSDMGRIYDVAHRLPGGRWGQSRTRSAGTYWTPAEAIQRVREIQTTHQKKEK